MKILIIILSFFLISCGCGDDYLMPNGVRCEHKYETIFNKLEFTDCEDGKTYLNPETYERVPGCK